jgi:hypothetical protein
MIAQDLAKLCFLFTFSASDGIRFFCRTLDPELLFIYFSAVMDFAEDPSLPSEWKACMRAGRFLKLLTDGDDVNSHFCLDIWSGSNRWIVRGIDMRLVDSLVLVTAV